MKKLNSWFTVFLESPRWVKRLISVGYDSISVVICLFLAFNVSNSPQAFFSIESMLTVAITLVTSLFVFVRAGYYRAILRYMGLQAVFSISFGITVSALLFTSIGMLAGISVTPMTILLFWAFSLVTIGGARLFMIAIIRAELGKSTKIVAIYGAGQSGRQLAKALTQGNGYKIVAYIDDEPSLFQSVIDAVKVYSPISISRIIEKYNIVEILLAMPSVTHARRAEILNRLELFPVKIKTIASLEEIVSGKVRIEQLKEIELEDLLGRDSVEPDEELLHSCISEKVVMVTGAGGSIGSELCRQVLSLKPKRIVLYEISEFGLYTIEKELGRIISSQSVELENIEIISVLGSVQNKRRLTKTMKIYSVQTVYHAAAYKHVPIVEQNVVAGVRNNVFGTWYAAEAAVEADVEHFVLISTDKAVRPTNIMGASKRLAELVLQGISQRKEKTQFAIVRFGNVLGSSGSVVPLFREQILAGEAVTVTHRDIIRYFMTIPEAAQLVIQAGAIGEGGEVFVLEMGEQVKIAELAEKMVHLMGLTVANAANPHGDIEIKFSGLRPGEKLYEELLIGENVVGTSHPKILCAKEDYLNWSEMNKVLLRLDELCSEMDCEGIIELLLSAPTGYNPQHSVCDLLWNQSIEQNKDNIIKLKRLS